VIRHGIDDLPRERVAFGGQADWDVQVPPAQPKELELMLRMDRALRVAKEDGSGSSKAAKDPRFDVGWRHLDCVRENLKREASQFAEPAKVVVENHLKNVKRLRGAAEIHPKTLAVGETVKSIVEQGEKVVLFCDHHATAQELTIHLATLDFVAPKTT
jgi:hypothetical protein